MLGVAALTVAVPLTARPDKVPTEVILVCAAPVTVAAVPDTLPVTLPVSGPTKPADAVTVPGATRLPPSFALVTASSLICTVSIVSFTGTLISVCVKVATSIVVPFAGAAEKLSVVPDVEYELFC